MELPLTHMLEALLAAITEVMLTWFQYTCNSGPLTATDINKTAHLFFFYKHYTERKMWPLGGPNCTILTRVESKQPRWETRHVGGSFEREKNWRFSFTIMSAVLPPFSNSFKHARFHLRSLCSSPSFLSVGCENNLANTLAPQLAGPSHKVLLKPWAILANIDAAQQSSENPS